ncbi:MAG: DUF5666 domain-containing protein [Gammaproteobacteria bacterium]|nr:DUF5666 domain-containing protein [Gammaproteobacteria bacterium]
MYRLRFVRTLAVSLCLVLLTPACGGGGGSASVAVGGTSGSGVTGGTSGSGVTGGAVNSFGSVVVNGTSYLTSSDDDDIDTEFVGPGADFAETDLAPGMLVQVNWQRDDEDDPRQALRITYLPDLRGPVTAAWSPPADGQPARLGVAGRTVELPSASVLDDPFGRATAGVATVVSAEELSIGTDRIEVSGFLIERDAATGASVIRASRIARVGQQDAANPPEIISGVVHASSAGNFDIVDASGDVLTVTFDAAAVADDSLFDAAGSNRLSEGATVRVTGQLDGADVSNVSEIRRPLDDLQPISDDEAVEGEIDGLITAEPDSDNVFRVAGQLVGFDSDTEFSDGTAADLRIDQRVKVEGELRDGSDGVRILQAEEIDFEQEAEVELADTVATALSGTQTDGTSTFDTRIGVTVLVRPQTVLKDDSDTSPNGRLNLNDLQVGDFVEVDGYFDGAGRLVAVTLERDDEDDGCKLEARVADSEAPGASRRYTIDGRPGLVIADVGDDPTIEKILPGALGEFEAGDLGDCSIRPDGTDIDGQSVDAGFLAGEVDGDDDGDD